MPKVKSHIEGKRTVDYLGGVMLILGLVPFLLGLVWGGNEYAWGSAPIIGIFLFALISLIIFIFVEKKAKEPIMPLSLFKNRIFSVSMIIVFLTAMGMFGAILYIPLFAQAVLGVSATDSGFILTPLMMGLIISSTISGQIISRTGKYKVLAIVGIILVTAAMFALTILSVGTTNASLAIRIAFLGVGLGITMPIFNIAVQNAFPQTQLGVVTASVQLFRSVGGTVGTAIMGSVLNNALASKLSTLSSEPFAKQMAATNPNFSVSKLDANALQGFLSKDVQLNITSKLQQLPVSIQPQAMDSFHAFIAKAKEIFASSVSEVFIIGTVLMSIALLVSFFLKEIPLRKSHRPGLEEAGVELALEEGNFTAENGSKIREKQ
jgi:MFS family permease